DRHILPRLEEAGFVQQAHTSAVRVPTGRGYRFYVDLLLESKRSNRDAHLVEARLRRDTSGALPATVLLLVWTVLARALRNVGFALRPAHATAVFERVEFIPLSSSRVLVVIVAHGGHVLQKVIDTDEVWDADGLRQAANYLNSEFSG